jgi:plasmid stabilization system protein ParE
LTQLAREAAGDDPAAREKYGQDVIHQLDIIAPWPKVWTFLRHQPDPSLCLLIHGPHRIFFQVCEEPLRMEILAICPTREQAAPEPETPKA